MSFFTSDIVRSEMEQISILQEEVYKNVFNFAFMDNEQKRSHIDTLEKLLNKQQVLYTRLSLSDDPEAIQMKQKIIESAQMMGMNPDVDMNVVFNSMSKLIDLMKRQLDNPEDVG
jgi:hypothetical protein